MTEPTFRADGRPRYLVVSNRVGVGARTLAMHDTADDAVNLARIAVEQGEEVRVLIHGSGSRDKLLCAFRRDPAAGLLVHTPTHDDDAWPDPPVWREAVH